MSRSRPLGRPLNRRRLLIMAASGASLPFLGRSAGAAAHRWTGTALGADAAITLAGPSGTESGTAAEIFAMCEAEIARLEALFSLHKPASLLNQLNKKGRLAAAPADFSDLIAQARLFHEETQGAFDPTIQPLWQLYADHFAQENADPGGPTPAQIEAARALVGFQHVTQANGAIAFARAAMSLSLNGIAQGFITDKITDLLKTRGYTQVLVNMGEWRGLGVKPTAGNADGAPWQIGLQDPANPHRASRQVPLADAAIATSAPYGTRFDPSGRFHHLFDPRTAKPTTGYRSLSIIAPTATQADALSTGCMALTLEEIRQVLSQSPGRRAILQTQNGTWRDLAA